MKFLNRIYRTIGIIGLELRKILTTKKCILISSKHLWQQKNVKRFQLPKTYSAQVRALQRNPEQKDRIMSYEHIRKFHNAMLFGASEKGVNLSGTYLIEMKKFLDNYKKEVASKKKKGLLMKAIQILLLSHYIAWLQTGSLRKIIFLVGCS